MSFEGVHIESCVLCSVSGILFIRRTSMKVPAASRSILVRERALHPWLYFMGRDLLGELRGHEDAVQTVCLDAQDARLVSASSDCTFRLWS